MKTDGDRLILEGAEEVSMFEELARLARNLREPHAKRAAAVFECWLSGQETVDISDINDPKDKAWIQAQSWVSELESAIETNLDSRSFGHLVELIAKNHESAMQAARALKRHSENHAMKADVFAWLDSNFANYKSMESAATAIFENKLVPIKSWRTARDWVSEWKKLRSASTP